MDQEYKHHPVSKYIDQDNPDFVRQVTRIFNNKSSQNCDIKIWRPVLMEDGVWVTAIQVSDIEPGGDRIIGLPGEDSLDSFLHALGCIRGAFEYVEGDFFFGRRNSPLGGINIP